MPVQVGPRLRISDLIQRARNQGCELRTSKLRLVMPEGPIPIRFLYNPKTGGRFDLTDYADDEFMLGSEIEAVKRRLGITLLLMC